MAIYQYYLALIPRKGMIELTDTIPKRIDTDFRNREKYLTIENTENYEIDSFEILNQDVWNNSDLSSNEIIIQVDKIIKRADWGNEKYLNNWKIENSEKDNDAWIELNEKNGKIELFTIRADLREKDLEFLNGVLQIAKRFDLLLIDVKGNVLRPEKREIFISIENSNAFRFVRNP